MKIFKPISIVSVVLVLFVVSSMSAFAANQKRIDLDATNYFTVSGYDTETSSEWGSNGSEKLIFSDYNSRSPITITYEVDKALVTVILFSYETKQPDPAPHTFTTQETTQIATKTRKIENPGGGQTWGIRTEVLDSVTFHEPGYYHVKIKQDDGKVHNLFVHILKEGEPASTAAPETKPSEPTATAAPEAKPSEPAATATTPDKSLSVTARPTASAIIVEGQAQDFEVYNINDNNYFKLRDLAMAVNGSGKQFEVSWDAEKNAINLLSTSAYTPVGGEMAISGQPKTTTGMLTTSKIYKDGQEVQLTAYNIGGNNYFKLRDIAQAFNIGVTWDAKTKTIAINTSIDYISE
ncbi:stalk domain-containing protein [Paenibacillus koleovorans]|uniref:stalk domain-containing protein n=1 Tax=Paenibacillus koleovorans TaxID=121608 RepID=UPI000FDC26A3|nr:stalk domain-containing protein [Paenibacillus koleovorans]